MRVKQIMTVLSVLAAFQLGCSNLDVATSQAEVDALQKVKRLLRPSLGSTETGRKLRKEFIGPQNSRTLPLKTR